MSRKKKFDILFGNTLQTRNIIRTTSQKTPFMWEGIADANNIGGLVVNTSGIYSGEVRRSYEVEITDGGLSDEAKFRFSNDGGNNFLGWDGSNWVPFDNNARLIDFENSTELTESVLVDFNEAISGEANDKYFFKGEYRFPVENLFDLRPTRSLRSGADEVDWEMVWDMGSYGYLFADAVVALGFNVPLIRVQANDTDAWDNPDVSKDISFIEELRTVDDILQTRILSNDADWQQKDLVGKHIRMNTGAASGEVYKITDNFDNELVIEGDGVGLVDDGVAINDTFELFGQNRFSKLDASFRKRFGRLFIPSSKTSEGYYEGTGFKVDKSFNPSIDYQQGNDFSRAANVEITTSLGGSEQVYWKGEPEKHLKVNFEFINDETKRLFDAARNYLKDTKSAFYFIPDNSISGEVHPVRYNESHQRSEPVDKRFSESWDLKIVR